MASHSKTDVPEQTHESMQAGALRPVSGPAATPDLAASGGLELPGRERHDSDVPIVGMDRATHEPIPGERDADTLTHRDVGAMGGAFNGQDNVSNEADSSMDASVRRDRAGEGGGAEGAHRLDKRGGR